MQYEIAYMYGPPPGDREGEGEDGGEGEDKPRPYYAYVSAWQARP